MTLKFIMGSTPFTEWDNYIATLKKMGLDDYMKIYKAAYDRYSKK
jgi:putative aldouronate transport system substrate-binding protein